MVCTLIEEGWVVLHSSSVKVILDVCKGVMPAEQHRAITQKARKTHHIERCNHTLRQCVSRLVRETLSFSKTLTN